MPDGDEIESLAFTGPFEVALERTLSAGDQLVLLVEAWGYGEEPGIVNLTVEAL